MIKLKKYHNKNFLKFISIRCLNCYKDYCDCSKCYYYIGKNTIIPFIEFKSKTKVKKRYQRGCNYDYLVMNRRIYARLIYAHNRVFEK